MSAIQFEKHHFEKGKLVGEGRELAAELLGLRTLGGREITILEKALAGEAVKQEVLQNIAQQHVSEIV